MGFKEDADFARFVSMGAIASDAVRTDLSAVHGHRIIELERYAMSNKVWQTKVKRLRLPDLVCVRCGLRVESRGKSRLGIVLSHSDAVGRAWDEGGMRSGDVYAFVRVDLSEERSSFGSPLYLRTEDLRATRIAARESNRKAISEGSEVTLTWPAWVAPKDGTFIGIDEQDRLECHWDDGTSYRYYQWRTWLERHAYVVPGAAVRAHETVVAGCVAGPGSLDCEGDQDWLDPSLRSGDATDRYTAIKSARFLGRSDLITSIAEIAESDAEDWRIRLEAVTTLAHLRPEPWTERLAALASDANRADEELMEATFALTELATPDSTEGLLRVARQTDLPDEVRSAAAWGLGQGKSPSPECLLPFTVDACDLVALHALVAIEELSDPMRREMVDWLSSGDDRKCAIAAYLLSRHGCESELLAVAEAGDAAAPWALRALGDCDPETVERAAGTLSAQLSSVLRPMWIARRDWVRQVGEEGVAALEVQKVRFDPGE